MKNLKKWLPILLIALVTMFLTGCKIDWTTVSATETNKFAFGTFWALVHILVPVIIYCCFLGLIVAAENNEHYSVASGSIFGLALIGVYVFHFFYLKVDWFNLTCLTQLGFWGFVFAIYGFALFDDTIAESVIYSLVSAGIVVVSLLANAFTGKYLEPFVFSCIGWFAIFSGSIARKVRDDSEIGAEILSSVLCLAAMIFAITHASVPHYLYMITIQCTIATLFSFPFITLESKKGTSFVVLILNYVWVFFAAVHYNAESFKKSLSISLIGWGVLLLLYIIAFIIFANIEAKEAAARAAIEAQKARQRAAEKQRKAEEAAKKKAEEEAAAKIKAEEEAKAKQLAEIQPTLQKLESELEAKKAEAASLASDAQGIMKKAKLNKEIKELEPQVETLKAEVERLSK